MQYLTSLQTVLSEKGADGVGTTVNVSEWKEIWVAVTSASSANLVLTFLGAGPGAAPAFASAISASNLYTTLSFSDPSGVASELPDATAGTGVTFSGTDQFKIYKILNGSGMEWFNAKVASWAAGNVSVSIWGLKEKHV